MHNSELPVSIPHRATIPTLFCDHICQFIILPCRLRLTRMFCLECARSIAAHQCEETPPRTTIKWSHSAGISLSECGIALATVCKYTMKLLSMCAPEMLRPLAAHNTKAIIENQLHRVILPNLHDVERIIRNRYSHAKVAMEAADAASVAPFQIIPRDWTVDCDLYLEPEWSDSESSSLSSMPSSKIIHDSDCDLPSPPPAVFCSRSPPKRSRTTPPSQ
jgi:hypothetical protein